MDAYTIHDALKHVIGAWTPPEDSSLDQDALQKLNGHWRELRRVYSVNAWSSVTALSVQIVEGLLKHRLINETARPELASKTLAPLIDLAIQEGVLGSEDSRVTGSTVLSTTHIIRNWASHYSVWFEGPNETRAGQALVLMVATSKSLYLSPPVTDFSAAALTEDPLERWSDHHPRVLVSALERLPRGHRVPPPLVQFPYKFCVHVARHVAPRSLTKLIGFFRSKELQLQPLQSAINDRFLDVIVNATSTSFRALYKLVGLFREIGLAPHAQLLAILLPSDPEFLGDLIKSRSPAWVARYVAECFRAEPSVFAFKAVKKLRPIVDAFWQRFSDHSGNILNMANILAKFPFAVRIEILRQAPVTKLVRWIENSDPQNSVNLLGSLRESVVSRASDLLPLQQQIVAAITSGVCDAPLARLHRIPLRLHRIGVTNESTGAAVLQEVLRRTETDEDWSATRRILWDVYQYCEPIRQDAAETALRILAQHHAQLPQWEQLCISGITELARPGCTSSFCSSDIISEEQFLKHCREGRDRWQVFLALLGLATVLSKQQRSVPHSIVRVVAPLYDSIETPQTTASETLVRIIGEYMTPAGDERYRGAIG